MPNVVLRPLALGDTSNIVRWRNQDFVRDNLYSQNLLTEEQQIRYFYETIEPGHVYQYVIAAKTDGRETDIGTVFFKNIDRESGCAEIGIFIGERDFLGGGYGTSAIRAALQVAFSDLQIECVYARIKKDNIPSQKLFVKNGFQPAGTKIMQMLADSIQPDTTVVEMREPLWRNTCNAHVAESTKRRF